MQYKSQHHLLNFYSYFCFIILQIAFMSLKTEANYASTKKRFCKYWRKAGDAKSLLFITPEPVLPRVSWIRSLSKAGISCCKVLHLMFYIILNYLIFNCFLWNYSQWVCATLSTIFQPYISEIVPPYLLRYKPQSKKQRSSLSTAFSVQIRENMLKYSTNSCFP